jgi:hypothetical protein
LGVLALALIEPERERIDLALELTEATREAVALFPERLGERDHRVDQAMLTVVVGCAVVHAPPSRPELAQQRARRMPRRRSLCDAHLRS